MTSIFVPVAYVTVLLGALFIFSHFYRKRSAIAASERFDPWFPSHPERDTYITLLQQDPPAHDALLKAALLRRAVADVKRLWRIREDKPALSVLVQKGSVGDDLWTAILQSEKELDAEMIEVVSEASTFSPGWEKLILQTASEIAQNERLKEIYTCIPKDRGDTKADRSIANGVLQETEQPLPAEAVPPTSSAGKKSKKRR